MFSYRFRWLYLAPALFALACGGKGKQTGTPAGTGGGSSGGNSTCLDNDGDGVPGTGQCADVPQVDCDDTMFAIHPGAAEVCNGVDDNCDGKIDDGLTFNKFYL